MSKPVMVVSFMSTGLTRLWRGFGQKQGLPIVEDLQRGLKAVRRLVEYASYRRAVKPPTPNLSPQGGGGNRSAGGGGVRSERHAGEVQAMRRR